MAYDDSRKSFLSANLVRAKHRDKARAITITVDDLFHLGEKQQWKCNLTGIPLEFTRGGGYYGGKWINPNSCSIDRIDSTKDYLPGNVQLVCAAVNDIKSCYELTDFVKYAKLIVEKYEAAVVVAPVQMTLPGSTITYSARGAAKASGKSRTYITNAIKKGKLQAKTSSRKFEIAESDLEKFIKG